MQIKITYLFLFLLSLNCWAQGLRQEFSIAEKLFEQGRYQEALKLYRQIAEETAYPDAQFRVGIIFAEGLGIEPDYSEATRWFTLAANQGHTTAQANLYILYLNDKNEAVALTWLKRSVAGGNASAEAILADLYANGTLVEKNEYEAYALASRSANKGSVLGKYRLAQFYLDGVGVPANPKYAIPLLEEVARHTENYPAVQSAQLLLGTLYEEGVSVPQNFTESYYWYLVASSGGDASIASIAREKRDVLRQRLSDEILRATEIRARNWQSNEISSTISKDDLRQALIQALGRKDYTAAAQMAESLPSENESESLWMLGVMHQGGTDRFPKDLLRAQEYFSKACDQGFLHACLSYVEVLLLRGQSDQAIKQMLRLNSKNLDSIDVKAWAGSLYYDVGLPKKAEVLLMEVWTASPTDDTAQRVLNSISRDKKWAEKNEESVSIDGSSEKCRPKPVMTDEELERCRRR